MKTGFLMVNYNDCKGVFNMLEQISSYDCIDKIVIVDNASSDNSMEKLKKINNEKIVILSNKENLGYGGGINTGAKYLNDLYDECNIIISNTDIIINAEDDIKTLLSNFNEETAIVAPVIKEHNGYNRGWKVPTPFDDLLCNISLLHTYFRKRRLLYPENYYNKQIVEVEAVSGCFFIIKGSILKQIDYFDENLFLYYEENMIAKKLESIKKRSIINTSVEVFHNHSVTIDHSNSYIQKYDILKKSQLYFQKHYQHASGGMQLLLKMTSQFSKIGTHFKHFLKRGR